MSHISFKAGLLFATLATVSSVSAMYFPWDEYDAEVNAVLEKTKEQQDKKRTLQDNINTLEPYNVIEVLSPFLLETGSSLNQLSDNRREAKLNEFFTIIRSILRTEDATKQALLGVLKEVNDGLYCSALQQQNISIDKLKHLICKGLCVEKRIYHKIINVIQQLHEKLKVVAVANPAITSNINAAAFVAVNTSTSAFIYILMAEIMPEVVLNHRGTNAILAYAIINAICTIAVENFALLNPWIISPNAYWEKTVISQAIFWIPLVIEYCRRYVNLRII